MKFFTGIRIEDEFKNRYEVIETQINQKKAVFFNSNDDDLIVSSYLNQYSIEPIVLDEKRTDSNIEEIEPSTRQLKVFSMSLNDSFTPDFDGQTTGKTYKYTSYYKYSGNSLVFEMSNDIISLGRKYDFEVNEKDMYLCFIVEAKHNEIANDVNFFYKKEDEAMKSFRNLLSTSNSLVAKENRKIEEDIRKCISKRKEELKFLGTLIKNYNIEVKEKNPQIIKVFRKVGVELVQKSNDGRIENYSIEDRTYKDILEIIRHHTRTMERLPSTFSKLNENEIRDILLAALNCIYMGNANGEVFRKKGKTDICIEEKNRSAFIAELKFWKGEETFNGALHQLLSYTTWRDNKLALIILTKTTKILHVIEKIHSILNSNSNKVQLKKIDDNEFDYKCTSEDYIGMIFNIRVYVIDLTTN